MYHLTGLLVFTLPACGDDNDDEASETTVPSIAQPEGPTVDRQNAIDRVVSTVCARYQECSVLGVIDKFDTEEDCRKEVQAALGQVAGKQMRE